MHSENVNEKLSYSIVTFYIVLLYLDQPGWLDGYLLFGSKKREIMFILLFFWLRHSSRKNLLIMHL